MGSFSSAAFSTNAFSVNAFFFDTGAPAVNWIDGVGYGGVSGSGVWSIAHDDAGTPISSVSKTKTDAVTRRWKNG